MENNKPYRAITREQFLYKETKTVARLILEGKTDQEIISDVVTNNLFQYPTEKSLSNLAKVCLARLHEVSDSRFFDLITNGSIDASKQTCLYLIYKQNRLVKEFMLRVIGNKYANRDLYFEKKDVNAFFTDLKEQSDEIASWSDSTITKCKQVLIKLLVESGYIDSTKSNDLHSLLLDFDLKEMIINDGDEESLVIFGYIE